MKLAVTDACIFIDLFDTELIAPFFGLAIEVHTSLDVVNELYGEQRQTLREFEKKKRLTVHNISGEDRLAIAQATYPKALSESDKTVLHLAITLDAIVLSSDGVVRRCANVRCIKCHGMLWIFERLVEETVLLPAQAAKGLEKLTERNVMYRTSQELVQEVTKRLKLWKSS